MFNRHTKMATDSSWLIFAQFLFLIPDPNKHPKHRLMIFT